MLHVFEPGVPSLDSPAARTRGTHSIVAALGDSCAAPPCLTGRPGSLPRRCWALPFEPRRLSRASAAERWPSRACRAGARVLSCDRTTPSLATKHAMTATAFSETALGCPASERTSAVAAGVQHRAGCWRASRGHRVRVLIGCTRARPASAAIGACLRPTGWTGEALAMRRASRPRRSLVRRMFRPNLRDGRREGGGARKGHR